MQLSVIIVSYNVKYYLEQCLHSVLAGCKNLEAEIIVVDNASKDKSIEYLQPKFSQVIFIHNENNAGFAKANNKVLNSAKGSYILYLNPDTIVCESTIESCIYYLNEHAEAGAVGVKMIDGSGNFLPESKRAFPSVMASFFKLSGMATLLPRSAIFNKYALGNLNENKIHKADVLAGAFLLSRKDILISLNGFDEDFFMYGEDIDLSYRIIKSGYKNYYLGNNMIVHFKGESAKFNKNHVKNFYDAMKIFVNKHHKTYSSALLNLSITTGAFISSSAKKTKQFFLLFNKEKINKHVILIGDEKAIASAAAILQAKNYAFKTLTLEDEKELTGELLNVKTKLKKLQPEKCNLVFCLDKLTYSACIQFMQNNKNRFVYYWHYKGSESIVSGSKTVSVNQIYIAV